MYLKNKLKLLIDYINVLQYNNLLLNYFRLVSGTSTEVNRILSAQKIIDENETNKFSIPA